RQARPKREHRGSQRCRDNGGNRATVGKRVGVLFAREQRIERNGNNSGAHRSQERDRIVRRVVKNKENTILLANPQFSQRRAKPVGFILQLAIAERTRAVVESNLVAETARNIPVDQVGGSVVRTALQEVFEHLAESTGVF